MAVQPSGEALILTGKDTGGEVVMLIQSHIDLGSSNLLTSDPAPFS